MKSKTKIVAYICIAAIVIATVIATKDSLIPLIFAFYAIKHVARSSDDDFSDDD